jgi:type IV secretory pathway TraG/TraD family ATPase VirD4
MILLKIIGGFVLMGIITVMGNRIRLIRRMLFLPRPSELDPDPYSIFRLVFQAGIILFLWIYGAGKLIPYVRPIPLIGEFLYILVKYCLPLYWLYIIMDEVRGLFPKRSRGKLTSTDGFELETTAGTVLLNNPFRGVFISGGAGAGKSQSLIEPLLIQAGKQNYSGVVYDFKFPVLAEVVNGAFSGRVKPYFINFTDLNRSHRINPIDPAYLLNSVYAREAAITILKNLDSKAYEKRDFWIQSAETIFTGVILFLKNNYPNHCTIPHAVSLILDGSPEELIALLSSDLEVKGIISSVRSACGSEKTLSSMFATLQNYLSLLNTKEIFYVTSKSDFHLELNDPENPILLVIGNDDRIRQSLSPIISLIMSQAIKQMNRPGRHKSLVLLDEAPTINIPNFSQLPATGRSNRIATVYAVQDFAQMEAELGRTDAERIISNLNNQFYGRTTNIATAERVSRLFGEYEKMLISESKSRSSKSIFDTETTTSARSSSIQLRKVLEPREVVEYRPGQFAGILAESNYIRGEFYFKPAKSSYSKEIEPFSRVDQQLLDSVFAQIKDEASQILNSKT